MAAEQERNRSLTSQPARAEYASYRQSAASWQPSRVDWIDAAKGAGILLVVLGHVLASGMTYDAIYTFHMPMFFILSGIVYRAEPVASQFVKRLLSLMVPYACFLLIVMLMQNTLDYTHGVSMVSVLQHDAHQLLLGLDGGRALTGDYGTFWFVSCLFLSLVAYNAIRTRLRDPLGGTVIAAMIALLLIAYPLRWFSWPWNAAIVPLAVVLLWVGECWWTIFGRRGHRADSRLLLAVSIVVAVLGLMLVAPFDMKYGHYGTHVASVVVAVALSHLFFVACMRLANIPALCKVLVQFGQASLVILFLHRFLVLRLDGQMPAVAVFFAAAGLPFLFWLVIRRSPLPVRRALLGDRPPRRKIDAVT